MTWEYLMAATSDRLDRYSPYVFVDSIIDADHEKSMTQLGADGWELVTIHNGFAYFKRPKMSESVKETPSLADRTIASKAFLDHLGEDLEMVEQLRQMLVKKIVSNTLLSAGNFEVEVNIHCPAENQDFYGAALGLGWWHETGTDWIASESPSNGATIVYLPQV